MTAATLDFAQPIALMLVAVLHFVPDEAQPRRIVDTLLDALPLRQLPRRLRTSPPSTTRTRWPGPGRAYQERGLTGQIRTADEFAELAFRGLEMVDPGLVLVSEWRPRGTGPRPMPSEVNAYGGVARKP